MGKGRPITLASIVAEGMNGGDQLGKTFLPLLSTGTLPLSALEDQQSLVLEASVLL